MQANETILKFSNISINWYFLLNLKSIFNVRIIIRYNKKIKLTNSEDRKVKAIPYLNTILITKHN